MTVSDMCFSFGTTTSHLLSAGLSISLLALVVVMLVVFISNYAAALPVEVLDWRGVGGRASEG